MQLAIEKLRDGLHQYPHFCVLKEVFSRTESYLVGGAIRDLLLARPISDLDLISPRNPTELAKIFASQVGGHWFWLDEKHQQSRVVLKQNGTNSTFDFAPFRALDLENDLLDRDFTINAIALDINNNFSLTDPCKGVDDLFNRLLCSVKKDSFQNDPLRVIKGIRHAVNLNFAIEPLTLALMQNNACGLRHTPVERIRSEVWKILSSTDAERGLHLICDSRVGNELFGPGYESCMSTILIRYNQCVANWGLLSRENPSLQPCLEKEIEQGLSYKTLVLWSFLLKEIDRNLPGKLAEKWLFSRKAKEDIEGISNLEDHIVHNFSQVANTKRAFHWWAKLHHVSSPSLFWALVAILKPEEPSDVKVLNRLARMEPLDNKPQKDLIDGLWLRHHLSLSDGPEMSQVLQLLRKSEMTGLVTSREDAEKFLLQNFSHKD